MDYIITGMPRTKTAWLAVFFNSLNGCDCWHEVLSEIGLKQSLELTTRIDRLQGASDSGILFHWKEFISAYPKAKWIIMDRDMTDVFKSAHKAGIPEFNLEVALLKFEELLEFMDGDKRYYRLPFDFDENSLRGACDHIGVEWSIDRYHFLQKFNVQMSQRHVDFLNFKHNRK